MPKNVEIKAKVNDFNKIFNLVKNICGTDPTILNQEDVFFNANSGRLKLRNFQDGSASQLIHYNRPDIESPKISDYSICWIENPKELLNVLKSALGVVGSLKKTRYLFLCEHTRIHLDRVEGLGDFLELEVVLNSNQSIEEGEDIANGLMQKLEVSEKDLIKGAYIDLSVEK